MYGRRLVPDMTLESQKVDQSAASHGQGSVYSTTQSSRSIPILAFAYNSDSWSQSVKLTPGRKHWDDNDRHVLRSEPVSSLRVRRQSFNLEDALVQYLHEHLIWFLHATEQA